MNVDGDFLDAQDGSDTASTMPSSAAGTSTDMNLILTMLVEAKATGAEAKTAAKAAAEAAAEKTQADRLWQFNADKTAFDNKVAMEGKITTIATDIKNINGKCDAMDARITAIEGGGGTRSKSVGKGCAPARRVHWSPRAGGDPLYQPDGDVWNIYRRRGASTDAGVETPTHRQEHRYNSEQSWAQARQCRYWFAQNLEPRVGERKTVIIGGFPRDTGRADSIVEGHEGVERVTSMGRYSTCGRVFFYSKDAMWNFIKANKGKKFDFDGAMDALWFTI